MRRLAIFTGTILAAVLGVAQTRENVEREIGKLDARRLFGAHADAERAAPEYFRLAPRAPRDCLDRIHRRLRPIGSQPASNTRRFQRQRFHKLPHLVRRPYSRRDRTS